MHEERSQSAKKKQFWRAWWALPDQGRRDEVQLESVCMDASGLTVLASIRPGARYARIWWSSVVAAEMVPESYDFMYGMDRDRPALIYEVERSEWLPSILAVLPSGWPEPTHYIVCGWEMSLDVAATEPPRVEWGERSPGSISDLLVGGDVA